LVPPGFPAFEFEARKTWASAQHGQGSDGPGPEEEQRVADGILRAGIERATERLGEFRDEFRHDRLAKTGQALAGSPACRIRPGDLHRQPRRDPGEVKQSRAEQPVPGAESADEGWADGRIQRHQGVQCPRIAVAGANIQLTRPKGEGKSPMVGLRSRPVAEKRRDSNQGEPEERSAKFSQAAPRQLHTQLDRLTRADYSVVNTVLSGTSTPTTPLCQ
jgi:hypothetical protein